MDDMWMRDARKWVKIDWNKGGGKRNTVLKIYDALQEKQKSHNIATDDVTKFCCY